MSTQIRITGQPNGNLEIMKKLSNYQSKKHHFADIILEYETKKKAVDDLNKAFKKLANDEPEMVNKLGGLTIVNEILYYDASKAVVE